MKTRNARHEAGENLIVELQDEMKRECRYGLVEPGSVFNEIYAREQRRLLGVALAAVRKAAKKK